MSPADSELQFRAGSPMFVTTHWSAVITAANDSAPGAQDALDKLCRNYWYPLYAFIRRKGYPPHEAEDLTQGFFTRLLEKRSLQDASREKGKFRTFLLSAVTHFLANEYDKTQRLKRGGGFTFLPLETAHAEELYNQEQWNTTSPETAFDRIWAARMSEVVLARLRTEFQGPEQQMRFVELKPFLLGEPGAESYLAVAARLQISEQGVKSAVHRLRQRFVALFREEISQTVATRAEIDEELRYLVQLMTS